MNNHELYIQRCLQLAALGLGKVAPNPMVGAVLVYEGRIIGEGYHQLFGGNHAEVECLNSVKPADKDLIANSTLYVSLEPCNHFGKTPPCTNRIIAEGVKKVVIGTTDLSDKVNGAGIARLKDEGVEVITGVLAEECRKLNKRFFTYHTEKRPYIILKWAQSVDCFIAGPNMEQVPISNKLTNRLVHKWRSEEAGIMVGTNTALHDDPLLTTRLWPGRDPMRIIPDRYLKLPTGLRVFDKSASTLVLTEEFPAEEEENLHFTHIDDWELEVMLTYLYMKGIQSIIVEGGKRLIDSFIDLDLWDEARKIINSGLYIEDGISAPTLINFKLLRLETIGSDIIYYFDHKPSEQDQ